VRRPDSTGKILLPIRKVKAMHVSASRPGAVELLMSDHQTVLGKLDKLDQIFFKLEDDPASLEEADRAFFHEMISIFDTEIVVHFEREEKALFPVMERYTPRDMGPIAIMLEEHPKIFGAIDKFKEDVDALTDMEEPEEEFIEDMIYNVRSLIEMLRSHIDKEDNMLLPMAESHLNAAEWNTVFADMEKITPETITRKG
jgi:hemerythrin-like domain-containing protein